MKELTKAGLLDTSLPTVTGKTVGENLETAENLDTSLIRPLEEPYSKTGGDVYKRQVHRRTVTSTAERS